MDRSVVMTVVGPDRPGIVESIAAQLSDHGGNWLESRMSRLGGQFAGILRATVPEGKAESLAASLQQLSTQGLAIVVRSDLPVRSGTTQQLQLELIGQDRPGIVREISSTLARIGANIEMLETDCVSAPMSGEILFKASAVVFLPTEVSINTTREALEQIAADLMVDLRLTTETKSSGKR